MKMDLIRVVRLHTIQDGKYVDLEHEFELEELCETIPNVGDFIVEPGVESSKDRADPKNRIVYKVLERYFVPNAHGPTISYVALIVEPRQGTERDEAISTVA